MTGVNTPAMARLLGTRLRRQRDDGRLHAATRNGDYGECEVLLREGADVNEAKPNGATPLLLAAQGGFTDLVTLFIAWGARVDAAAHDRTTAVWMAAQNGHVAVCRVLLQHNAPVNAADSE